MGAMADRDYLARIDAHMERGNEHMERGNEHMERGNVLMGQVHEEMRLTREFMATELDSTRIFAQQMIARVDRLVRDNAKAMDRMVDGIDRNTDELVRQGAQRERDAAEAREESRAGRQALLAVIDRMDRFDPPSAAS